MDSSYISSKHLTKKPKKPWVFWFFALLQLRLPSKNQKNPRFFLVFKNLNQKKKKLKETQKKPSFDLKPKLLQKVLVFWFFGFLEVSSRSLFLFGRNSGSRIESVFHGNIYKIVVVGYNLCYLGSTCEKLSKRMERHRADCKIYVDGKKHFTTSYQYQMNMEKRKNELIENYLCLGSEELLKGEGFHIQNAECINFVWQKKLQNTKNITIR